MSSNNSNKKNVFVLLGPPGSGKGTQAEKMALEYQLLHIDTGQALRTEIGLNSPVGQLAKSYVDKGQLVPSDVVMQVIMAAMKRIQPEQNGYLLDGFPRNKTQADGLENILKQLSLELTQVFYLSMPLEELVDRLAFRVSCGNCGAKYNTKLNPTQVKNTCDKCGHVGLVTRKDDQVEVIQPRLKAYQEETEPLVAHYNQLHKSVTIDARNTIDGVFEILSEKLNQFIASASPTA